MTLYQVDITESLTRRFFVEAEGKYAVEEAVDGGIANDIDPTDDDYDLDIQALPAGANPEGPRWVGGPEGKWVVPSGEKGTG
jgi:hypothetical protein